MSRHPQGSRGLRLIAGAYKGRRLPGPPDDRIRPTTDRVREALFNLLAHRFRRGAHGLDGVRLLDAFAGTGALGLEALSRGAEVTFLDTSAEARRLVAAALKALEVPPGRARLLAADALKPPPADAPMEVVLLDPPYGQELGPPALAALAAAGWIGPETLAVVEHARPLDAVPGFTIEQSRTFGRSSLTLVVPEG
ncbi:16S rRNA (guanine(966)-N(2))-methyltransferase RsmD [Roseospirillum parvum]|uniref:16S rRNA (Guanine966-N2)-methyltransferase n=1 Tax=Roseospirillum parvum TaxID=83401 RepID=A0A1G7U3Q3_9PROT|nr:16S rRNA (guanine(966)-N(2))-methyltransferase RsmD [Roseospirillum parvum]SDG41891.1 16S rRNA (guanine966-N2)-methyltransferase [Roseospirillum parvum]